MLNNIQVELKVIMNLCLKVIKSLRLKVIKNRAGTSADNLTMTLIHNPHLLKEGVEGCSHGNVERCICRVRRFPCTSICASAKHTTQ